MTVAFKECTNVATPLGQTCFLSRQDETQNELSRWLTTQKNYSVITVFQRITQSSGQTNQCEWALNQRAAGLLKQTGWLALGHAHSSTIMLNYENHQFLNQAP